MEQEVLSLFKCTIVHSSVCLIVYRAKEMSSVLTQTLQQRGWNHAAYQMYPTKL